MSISLKLFLIALIALGTSTAGQVFVFSHFSQESEEEKAEVMIQQIISGSKTTLINALRTGDERSLTSIMSSYTGWKHLKGVYLLKEDWVIASSQLTARGRSLSELKRELGLPESFFQNNRTTQISKRNSTHLEAQTFLCFREKGGLAQKTTCNRLLISYDLKAAIQETQSDFQEQTLWAFLIALSILGISMSSVGHLLSSRINRLIEYINSIDFDKQKPEILDLNSNDEIGVISDSVNQFVAKIHQSNKKLRLQAYYDHLTQLMSRARFQTLYHDGARKETYALILADIDDFKKINDSFGHQVGEVARAIRKSVPSDSIIVRYGGEEFLILVPTTTENRARRYAKHLLATIGDTTHKIDDHVMRCTMSAGYRLLHPQDLLADVISEADHALGLAKESGKNRAVHASSSILKHTGYTQYDITLSHIENALLTGQLRFFFQPVVDAQKDNLVVGYEGLIRWIQEDDSVIPPAQFLQQFLSVSRERKYRGTIYEALLGSLAASKIPQGEHCYVSFNLAPMDIARGIEKNNMGLALIEAKNQGWNIMVEVTEDAYNGIDGFETLGLELHRLKDMGFKLALDDFGKSESNFGRLAEYNFDYVKIDRELVLGLASNAKYREVLRTMTELCRKLDIVIIAEGIEDADTQRRLLDVGILFHQGFLYARPTEPTSIQRMELQPAASDRTDAIFNESLEKGAAAPILVGS
jgi:diguanylate cyclase (GGDEF)-like protein